MFKLAMAPLEILLGHLANLSLTGWITQCILAVASSKSGKFGCQVSPSECHDVRLQKNISGFWPWENQWTMQKESGLGTYCCLYIHIYTVLIYTLWPCGNQTSQWSPWPKRCSAVLLVIYCGWLRNPAGISFMISVHIRETHGNTIDIIVKQGCYMDIWWKQEKKSSAWAIHGVWEIRCLIIMWPMIKKVRNMFSTSSTAICWSLGISHPVPQEWKSTGTIIPAKTRHEKKTRGILGQKQKRAGSIPSPCNFHAVQSLLEIYVAHRHPIAPSGLEGSCHRWSINSTLRSETGRLELNN